MQKFVCIHGHFYQPPRENPWLEAVELQDSAAPYHDWNERITQECYAPNATARMLNGEGKIEEIISNYSRMSFNFGPTLLAWMQEKTPEVHDAIIQADIVSRTRFSGHGSALAQVYNHMILPLANRRDKLTQTLWGIEDFRHQFGRMPEGMWLSETAADTETLGILAQADIRFTILSPYQASRARAFGKRTFRDVSGGHIDPTQPYLVRLPEKRSITVFFYDGPVSRAVAFEQLLSSGERLAGRLMSAFDDARARDQLVHIATDGESYGHHHYHGEMALAYALEYMRRNNLARVTNYGEYLETHPPAHEAQIHEKTAWSCVHGVGRWMEDCGCNTGAHPGWNQAWRRPLRNALDWLRDELAPAFEKAAREILHDPWAARDDYIHVILDRSEPSREAFLQRHAVRELKPEEKVAVWKLMELQRHAMLMYTSCGWFFDELSGIETVQIIQYAGRALQLGREVLGIDLEPGFLERLQLAKSNLAIHGDGRLIFDNFVKPAVVDRRKAVAHYAISSIFHIYPESTRIFSYRFDRLENQILNAGKMRLATGQTRVTSEITGEFQAFSHAILYLGEHNLTGGVREFQGAEAYAAMAAEIKTVFESGDIPGAIRTMDRHFGESPFSLNSLFQDERRQILTEILGTMREDLEVRFRLIVDRYTPLMKFIESAGAPAPPALEMVLNYVLHRDLIREVSREDMNPQRLEGLLAEAGKRPETIIDADAAYAITQRMERMMRGLVAAPESLGQVEALEVFTRMVMPLHGLNLWKIQNMYWELLREHRPGLQQKIIDGDEAANVWMNHFIELGDRLGFAGAILRNPSVAVPGLDSPEPLVSAAA